MQGVVSFFIASDGKIQCILLTQLVVIMLHRLLSIIELCICAFLADRLYNFSIIISAGCIVCFLRESLDIFLTDL